MVRKVGLPVFAILLTMFLLVTPAFAAEIEISELITGIVDQITGWLKSSPLTTFISSSSKTKDVHVILYPQTFSMTPDQPVNIYVNNITFENFRGTIETSFRDEVTVLQESKADLKVNIPLTMTEITDLRIKQITAENMKVEVKPNMTAEDSSVELSSFSGTCTITPEYIEFIGNVTSLKAEIGGLEWELK